MYYIYIIRCSDNSLYTGITTDVGRRMREHGKKEGKGAKYTEAHVPKSLERVWQTENRQNASKLEYRIKSLRKEQKEDLVKSPLLLEKFFADRLDCEKYMLCGGDFDISFD